MTRDTASETEQQSAGPVLFLHGWAQNRMQLAALIARPETEAPPVVVAPDGAVAATPLLQCHGWCIERYAFALPMARDTGYWVDDRWYPVVADLTGELRIGYVSCNGQEHGDRERDDDERNALWHRLAGHHEQRPFHLLLHGGDQIYADEMLDTHPALQAWRDATGDTDCGAGDVEAVRERLAAYLLQRYVELYAQAAPGWMLARVPSLCMWDDHDICDGWGSLPAEALDAPVARAVFNVARTMFRVFQLGVGPDEAAPLCLDASGTSLTWALDLPGVSIVAPDLRSERRPERVMGAVGERAFDQALARAQGPRVLVMSSVPALGPRLSWVERALQLTPQMEEYEDDLRDQWQSRAHRGEWRAFLQRLLRAHEQGDASVTLLSGEIHLATRGTMDAAAGPVHQLVASGITHPPPPAAYALVLSALAHLGESPLADDPIRLHPLPGQAHVYTAQRNFLVLERTGARWSAWWELERDGATPALAL